MSANFIVYRSRNRFTGTLCLTLDTKHADSTIEYDAEKRYVAMCVEHNAVVTFKEHYFAGRAIAHVDEWCNECIKMIANGAKVENKVAMNPADLNATLHNDLRMAQNNDAYDKRWTHKKNVKKTTQRKADQVAMLDAEQPRRRRAKTEAKSEAN
jgi:hypothetical protein